MPGKTYADVEFIARTVNLLKGELEKQIIKDVSNKNQDMGLPLLITNKDGNKQHRTC